MYRGLLFSSLPDRCYIVWRYYSKVIMQCHSSVCVILSCGSSLSLLCSKYLGVHNCLYNRVMLFFFKKHLLDCFQMVVLFSYSRPQLFKISNSVTSSVTFDIVCCIHFKQFCGCAVPYFNSCHFYLWTASTLLFVCVVCVCVRP